MAVQVQLLSNAFIFLLANGLTLVFPLTLTPELYSKGVTPTGCRLLKDVNFLPFGKAMNFWVYTKKYNPVISPIPGTLTSTVCVNLFQNKTQQRHLK
ncbi:MAG: hypothetical protein AAGI07_12985 [Bacteroidota bacterium]